MQRAAATILTGLFLAHLAFPAWAEPLEGSFERQVMPYAWAPLDEKQAPMKDLKGEYPFFITFPDRDHMKGRCGLGKLTANIEVQDPHMMNFGLVEGEIFFFNVAFIPSINDERYGKDHWHPYRLNRTRIKDKILLKEFQRCLILMNSLSWDYTLNKSSGTHWKVSGDVLSLYDLKLKRWSPIGEEFGP